MANITYRVSTTATSPISTTAKNAPLTNLEFDGNLKSIVDDLASKSPLVSPTFGGVPVLPVGTVAVTQTVGDNSTKLATTAFTLTQISNDSPTKTGVGASGNWNINSTNVTGIVGIVNGGTGGTTATTALVALGVKSGAAGSTILASGTTAQRDGSPLDSYIRFNTTEHRGEFWIAGSGWCNFGGSYANTRNTSFGVDALRTNTGNTNNTSFGAASMYSLTTGNSNVAIGDNTLAWATTGGLNTAIGSASMAGGVVTGTSNTGVGYNSLSTITLGSSNTGVGVNAGSATVSGSNNVYLGSGAGSSTISGSNNVLIGAGTVASSGNASNETVIGNSFTTSTKIFGDTTSTGSLSAGGTVASSGGYFTSINTYPKMELHKPGVLAGQWSINSTNNYVFEQSNGNGVAVTTLLTVTSGGNFTASGNVSAYSDARLKSDLAKIPNAIEKVNLLTGYTFTRIDTGTRQTGLLAQDVQKVLPEAVLGGEYLSVAYGNMVGLLVEAIKELKLEVDLLKANQK